MPMSGSHEIRAIHMWSDAKIANLDNGAEKVMNRLRWEEFITDTSAGGHNWYEEICVADEHEPSQAVTFL